MAATITPIVPFMAILIAPLVPAIAVVFAPVLVVIAISDIDRAIIAIEIMVVMVAATAERYSRK